MNAYVTKMGRITHRIQHASVGSNRKVLAYGKP